MAAQPRAQRPRFLNIDAHRGVIDSVDSPVSAKVAPRTLAFQGAHEIVGEIDLRDGLEFRLPYLHLVAISRVTNLAGMNGVVVCRGQDNVVDDDPDDRLAALKGNRERLVEWNHHLGAFGRERMA